MENVRDFSRILISLAVAVAALLVGNALTFAAVWFYTMKIYLLGNLRLQVQAWC